VAEGGVGDLVVLGGDEDAVQERGAQRGLDGPGQQGLPGDLGEVLAGDAARAAAGRDDGDDGVHGSPPWACGSG
jgi:hypothetical protein